VQMMSAFGGTHSVVHARNEWWWYILSVVFSCTWCISFYKI